MESRAMPKYEPSPFSDPAAVDAWDSWFRWREGSRLYDLSIETTWLRVARALAGVENSAVSRWVQRFVDAQAGWQLLFDEKILASAGTGRPEWPQAPVAVLNASRFVSAPFTRGAQFNFGAFGRIAELAVRGLDNALLAQADGHGANGRISTREIRVGIIGLGNALLMLGHSYATAEARTLGAAIARNLAESCLRSSLALARERGACANSDKLIELSRAREMPPDLLAGTAYGLRHSSLTAITSQYRLALLANNVSDALDPISCNGMTHPRSSVYAVTPMQHYAADSHRRLFDGTRTQNCVDAQLAMRQTVQPWIDAPIDYPLQRKQVGAAISSKLLPTTLESAEPDKLDDVR
jgi:ribonucleoside-diphosphate reductase alpha chain